jgi:hypothetical protein
MAHHLVRRAEGLLVGGVFLPRDRGTNRSMSCMVVGFDHLDVVGCVIVFRRLG